MFKLLLYPQLLMQAFLFTLELFQSTTVGAIVRLVKQQRVEVEDGRDRITGYFQASAEDDMIQTQAIVSLKCPIR